MKNRTVIALTIALLLAPRAASAATTYVTACNSDTQPGAVNLAQALAAGGSIYFKCPMGTVIHVTSGHSVPGTTVIDGEGRITLDAQGAPLTLITSSGHLVILRGIIIRNIATPSFGFGRLPGSVLNGFADASAVLDHVTIEGCMSPVVVRGSVTVDDSTFARNGGYVLVASGTTTITRSTFTSNQAGALVSSGRIVSSDFAQNETGLSVLTPDGPVEIIGSGFERNGVALEMSQRSAFGPIVTVSVRRNRFEDNTLGAVSVFDNVQRSRDRGQLPEFVDPLIRLPPARFTLAYNRFLRNARPQGAAIDADLRNGSGMTVTGDLFVGNISVDGGGAIVHRGGALAISHSLFRSNQSGAAGAAIQVVPGSGGQLSIANTLIVENKGSGGAIDADAVNLANVTIAANDSVGLTVRGSSTIANAIFSRNASGNCAGVSAAAFRGGNLQFGAADCPGVAVGDPFLDELYVPALGSRALVLGDAGICASAPVSGMDIVFQSRLGRDCALGAFERPPLRHAQKSDDPYAPKRDTRGKNGRP